MIPLIEKQPSKTARARSELGAHHYIPYACHYNDQTLLTKSGHLVQFLRLDGFAFDGADPDDVDLRKRLRNVLLKSIASHDYALWFHTLRERQPMYPGGYFAPGFADRLNERWKHRHLNHSLYVNTLYVSIIKRGAAGPPGGFFHLFKALTHKEDAVQRSSVLQAECQDLSDITRRFERALTDYGARVLTVQASPSGPMSEPLSFLSRLINF